MTWILILGAVVIVVLLFALRRTAKAMATRQERLLALVVMGILPIFWLGGAVAYTDGAMKKVEFCTSCHVMERYGESLHAAEDALAATHFQNNRVDREKACYVCHTSYVAFGGIKGKIRGLRHVQAHYLGGHEGEIALYEPYSNSDCLRCHGDARSFLEQEWHNDPPEFLDELQAGDVSCLECHEPVHYFEDES
jgi:nitrate/TMAO reductase-like tetraheme cytochrome c subunit